MDELYVDLLSDGNDSGNGIRKTTLETNIFSSPIPIVETKLYQPPTPNGFIDRPRLNEILDKEISKSMMLISAPAGFGKSSLVGNWIEKTELDSAWVSLDETDNDLHQFFSYVVASIQKLLPGSCPASLSLLQASDLPPVTIFKFLQ